MSVLTVVDAGRRHVLRVAAAVGLVALLPGCGFELRRAPELKFRTIALQGFGKRSLLEEELRRNIDASATTHVVDTRAQAQVVLVALTDVRERLVAATTAVGQVTEFTLRTRLTFRLETSSGKVLIGDTEMILQRDMSYSETAALSKEQEENLLFRAMQNDIASQVLRRLAAVTL